MGYILSEDSINKVVTILEKHGACIHHEIFDRAWSNYKLDFKLVRWAIDKLLSKETIDMKIEKSPYGKPFHFFFLTNTDANKIDRVIDYKLRLLRQHSKLTQEIGDFGENLIGKIIEGLPYEEVEIRKKKHKDIGIGRKGIDVWGKHVNDYYQNIEVKNRRQLVDTNDIDNIITKTEAARNRWNLPVESALVCAFIYPKALEKANSANMPVAITKKVFVPRKYAMFYLNYRKTLGSHYIEIADSENPSNSLSDLILDKIHDHNYDE